MTDDSNKPKDESSKKPGGALPGPLPGLGGKPGGAAPLPGLGGKPGGAAPLPGLGGKPGGAAPLPGLGGAPKPVVPPFMQKTEPEKPPQQELDRDPFAQTNLPPQRSSYMPPSEGIIGGDSAGTFSSADAGRTSKPLIFGGVILALVMIVIGFLGGKAVSGRVALNIAIRDALITEWEIAQDAKLFNEVQTVVITAYQKAMKREYDPGHLTFLAKNVKGNPVNPRIFTDRNYKNFDAVAVQWLTEYNNKWGRLYDLIETHRRQTRYDEKMLGAAGEEFKKLLQTNYAAVFTRDDKQNGKFIANIVVLGTVEEKDGKLMATVQVDTGTFGDEREVYFPEPGDAELTTEPEKYVVEIGENSKMGVLKNATQSHFEAYASRLKEMGEVIASMSEIQANLTDKLERIASQDPVGFLGGIDPEEDFDEYVKKAEADATGGGAEAPAAE